MNKTDKTRTISFIKIPRLKIKKFSLPIFIYFISSTIHVHASSDNLAKVAGIPQDKLQVIIQKLVKIESRTGKYDVVNPRSGAYGRYQIMPSTAKFYAKKLNIPHELWKKPCNQDKIFHAIIKDNIKSLKRNGHSVSAFSIYAIHQQGPHGFNTIMKNRPITKIIERNMRKNLPKVYNNIPKSLLRFVWINYWKNRLG